MHSIKSLAGRTVQMFLKKSKGSITVFICIVLSVLIPLCCILTDIARYSMARKLTENALKLSVESVLAAYDRQIKEQYGLFALYPRDKQAIGNEIYDLLSHNLNIDSAADGVSDLYDFKIRNIDVITFYNLSEPKVLKQQIAEFMKYRAPVQAVQEFYEKLKIMKGLMKEADMVEKKIETEKLMNDIRNSLVNLYFMLEEQLKLFNFDPAEPKTSLKDNVLNKADDLWKGEFSFIGNANKEVEPIKEAQEGYRSLYPRYEEAKERKDDAESRLDSLGSSISAKQDELARLESEPEEADQNKAGSLESRISEIEEDLAELEEERGEASAEYTEAYERFSALDTEISKYKKVLDEKLSLVINDLDQAVVNNKEIVNGLNCLLYHLSTHKRYHSDLIALIERIEPSLEELDKKSREILDEAKDDDGMLADRVEGELDKQLQLMKKGTYSEIRSRLASNLSRLDVWIKAVSDCIGVMEEYQDVLNDALRQAEEVKNEPHKEGNSFDGCNDRDKVNTALETLKTETTDLKPLDRMEEMVYGIPSFELSPKANSNEYNSFKMWFNENYGDSYEVDEPAKASDSKLKEIRKSIKAFTEDAVKKSDENKESDGKDLKNIGEDAKNGLPSKNGAVSSDPAIEKIIDFIGQSQENLAVNDSFNDKNPLDGPVEGVGQADEKTKNFFDYQMEKVISVFNVIGKALQNGLEGIMDDLYMNEYIVSAFKCATTTDNKIEHDIGWGRALDKTYFDKGEVEYIIFGNDNEASNINLSRLSVFAIRLPFNLFHVYTDPEKNGAALSLATSIAGWTIFGVPVVHNFLLISWAGLESYADTEVLLNGGRIPLIKTSLSWILGIENLGRRLRDILEDNVKKYANDKFETAVNDVFTTVEDTVSGIVDAKIDRLFAPIEAKIMEVTEDINVNTNNGDGNTSGSVTIDDGFLSSLDFTSLESLSDSLGSKLDDYIRSTAESLKNYGMDKLEQYKSSLKANIKSAIFRSAQYNDLKGKIEKSGKDLINKGINYAADSIDDLLGQAEGGLSNDIKGKLIMMDYVDYLRLMLLAVPERTRALRSADLMQLNMRSITGNNDISMSQYNTYIFVRAEIDFNTWFLPEKLFKKDLGMISVEWSQGY